MLFCLYPIFKAVLITIVISFFVSWSIFRKYLRRQAERQEEQEVYWREEKDKKNGETGPGPGSGS